MPDPYKDPTVDVPPLKKFDGVNELVPHLKKTDVKVHQALTSMSDIILAILRTLAKLITNPVIIYLLPANNLSDVKDIPTSKKTLYSVPDLAFYNTSGKGWYRIMLGLATQLHGELFIWADPTSAGQDCQLRIYIDNDGTTETSPESIKIAYYASGGAIIAVRTGNDGADLCSVDVRIGVFNQGAGSPFQPTGSNFKCWFTGDFKSALVNPPTFLGNTTSSGRPANLAEYDLATNISLVGPIGSLITYYNRFDADRLNGTDLNGLTGFLYSTAGVITALPSVGITLQTANGSTTTIPATTSGQVAITGGTITLAAGTWIIQVRVQCRMKSTEGYMTAYLFQGASLLDSATAGPHNAAFVTAIVADEIIELFNNVVIVGASLTYTVKISQEINPSLAGANSASCLIYAMQIA